MTVKRKNAAVFLAASTALASGAGAADKAWSTTPADATFSGANWTPGTTPGAPSTAAAADDSLYFGTSSITALTNDLAAGTTLNGLTFNAGAAAFTISGNAFTLGGDVVNNSTVAQVINPNITLNAVRTVNTSTGNVTLFGAVTGAGGLIKIGTGTLTLRAGGGAAATPVSDYAGGTVVNAGSVVANRTSNTALGTGPVTVANGANVTIVDHAGGANQPYANTFNLTGSGTDGTGALKFFNSAAFSVTGSTVIAGGTTIATDPNAQTATITFNPAAGGGISGSGGLTLANFAGQSLGAGGSTAGAPSFTFTRATGGGSNTYTGDTRLTSAGKNVTPFTVTLSSNVSSNRLPTGTTLIFGGTPGGSPAGDFDKSVTLAINAANQQVAGLITANTPAAGHAYRIVGASATQAVFTVANAVDNTFNGSFGGPVTNNDNLRLVKAGVGVLTLGGASTYTGGTTISNGGGTLRITNPAAIGTGMVTNANIGVSTGTLELALTGANSVANAFAAFSPANVNFTAGGAGVAGTPVILNTSGNNTVTANLSAVNAGGGNGFALFSNGGLLTIAGDITTAHPSRIVALGGTGEGVVRGDLDSTPSTNVLAIRKAGSGTWTLTGTNDHTTTEIALGKLVTGNSSALGIGAVTVTNTATLAVGDGLVNTVGGIGGLSMADGTTLGIAANTGPAAQITLASGAFTLGAVTLDLNNQFNAAGSYTLIDGVAGANAIGTVTFADVNAAAFNYSFGVVGDDGVLAVTAVPEPAGLVLAGLYAAAGLSSRRRRRAR